MGRKPKPFLACDACRPEVERLRRIADISFKHEMSACAERDHNFEQVRKLERQVAELTAENGKLRQTIERTNYDTQAPSLVRTMLAEFPGERYDLLERVKDLMRAAGLEAPVTCPGRHDEP